MDKTPLDRVLEALSPALSAELNRMVQETRDALEQEFQSRLQTAVRDAESAAASAGQTQLAQALEHAKEETRGQVSADLQKQFDAKLEETAANLKKESAAELAKLEAKVKQLEADAKQLKDESSADRAKLQEELTHWKALAELSDELSKASSQPEILQKFLRLTQPFTQGLAIYVTKKDGLALWKSRGKSVFPDIISQDTTDPESYFRALSVRGKTVGAICAAPPFKMESLDFLSTSLERAIELFGIKLQAPAQKAASETK
jgi:hypothetical protein